MSDRELQFIFSENVGKLIAFLYSMQYKCSFGEAYRTQEQADIYAREGKGIKNSLHRRRLAIDLNLFSPEGAYLSKVESYRFLGDFWKKLNTANCWGGDFTSLQDPYHFSMSPDGKTK